MVSPLAAFVIAFVNVNNDCVLLPSLVSLPLVLTHHTGPVYIGVISCGADAFPSYPFSLTAETRK